ncbi:dihydrolipoamide succinyltransferase [Rugosibacter aromaticivorans]|uniref:Dihydrolipoyllysine-residue succinyltransferase component of 2-oxoglutarate dehydrogenase complex n=1 Tax=Rugosibacter aromaticivorans TaxID=1565605 RepID=A0A0C5IYQ3_9PROT|nr:2-oxoglutarate dehydrogenase complex dihydrolipoyllysine-residue succinyltransferase [Rugosibacter aromaticivorans]AJP47882.1 dihydrolipoamide succinyltransferase [Rugosibacter aromaticivorans]TBR15053.1 MAG: 2-oxoglutarate dehydrogenase complex dihydrolipoyllysine-residue succinyltransferase [Rugosibacter sp.]
MLIEVKVPQLSESVAEATLSAWHVKEGEAVSRDQNLIDIETDKVVLELPAPSAGVIVKIIKGNGATVVAGEVIAQLDTDATVGPLTTSAATPEPVVQTSAAVAASSAIPASAAPMAMPSARKIMDEKGLTATDVQGSGRGGRILKEDVSGVPKVAAPVATAVSPAPTFSAQSALPQPIAVNTDVITANRSEQRVPMSRLRVRVAERLLQSQATNAILTTFNEVNMAPVIELRKKYQEKFEKEHGVKLGFMSFFVKAAVAALKKYPVINASVDGNDIVYHGYFDIGIAVGSSRGLVVPILRDADQMSLAQIEKKIAEFGQKAKDGKLSLEELTGGTFSISNGGIFGSMLSTPIINPPQSAILGIHATKDRAVVENGQVVVRPINYLAMSYDHRIIDGREAVLGLVTIKEALEDPARLLLDI